MRFFGLVLLTLVLLLSGCSVSDMNDKGMVNVSIGDDGRYIAGGSSRVDEAYLGLIDEDVLYNFEELTNVKASGGVVQHTFAGIPVGDYTFLAILTNADEENIAMAVDPVTIEEGLNNLTVEMGPGFTLEIGGLDFELDDLDDVFTVEFNEDVITIELSVSEILTTFIPTVSNLTIDVDDSNANDIKILDWNENELGGFSFTAPADENGFTSNNTLTLTTPSLTTRFIIRMYSWATTGLYPDEKGYKDYKIELNLEI